MSLARTNRKLVAELRKSLDVEATQAALERGEITPVQARNIVKWIMAVKDIRANPIHPIQDDAGQYIGEILSRGEGSSWIGRRYGRNYPHDAAEFTDQKDAVLFVLGARLKKSAPQTHNAQRPSDSHPCGRSPT